jgi:hypothetical protein
VDVEHGQRAPRRIGTILVERGLISADELGLALKEQEATGRPLGEICVERFGLDRLSLADALAEQWEEMQHPAAATDVLAPEAEPEHDAAGEDAAEALSVEDELRVLLEEAQAARDELTVKTDELATRLAALETLVVGVTAALSELQPGNGGQPPKRSRSRARPAAAPATP